MSVAFTETDERQTLRKEVSKLAGGYGRHHVERKRPWAPPGTR